MRARPGTAAGSGSAPEGFADVYERYFADIYRYIAGRLGRSVADDIAADTFVIAPRKHADFVPGAAPCAPGWPLLRRAAGCRFAVPDCGSFRSAGHRPGMAGQLCWVSARSIWLIRSLRWVTSSARAAWPALVRVIQVRARLPA